MSKRNIRLLIVLLVIISMVIFTVFYSNKVKNTPNTEGDTGTGTNFVSDFFNFGVKNKENTDTGSDAGDNPDDISGYTPSNGTDGQKYRLTKVSSMPIAGFTIYMKEVYKEVANPKEVIKTEEEILAEANTTTPKTTKPVAPTAPATEFIPVIRYVAKETGNIYQSLADNILERKFTDTIIPKVHEAYFADKGNTVIMRYLKQDGKTIETFTGALPVEILGADGASSNEITGSFLPENITDMSVSSDTKNIFYLFNFRDGVAGTTATGLGSSKVQVFDSKYTEWLSQWPTSSTITITTKPASFVPGYMYAINPDRKDFKKVLGGINGLTTLTSPDGNSVLYSNNSLSMSIYNKQTGEYKQLGVRTLPEKCVWGRASDIIYCAVPKYINGSAYPDTWYQGEVSFSDDIWKIYATEGNASMILDPLTITEESSNNRAEEIDGVKLILDEGENFLLFVNKKDSYLWELRLK